jgi:hypothetical protein
VSVFGAVDNALLAPRVQDAISAGQIIQKCANKIFVDSGQIKWQNWLETHGEAKIKGEDGAEKEEAEIHPMDLLTINIGPYYNELIGGTDSANKEDMATYVAFTMAQLVPNMAESYNERQIHVCNQIMTTDRTSMHDDLLEALAVLRMNSKWILDRRDIFQDVMTHLDIGAMDDLNVME